MKHLNLLIVILLIVMACFIYSYLNKPKGNILDADYTTIDELKVETLQDPYCSEHNCKG